MAKDKDKDFERYMSKEAKERNPVYDPESSYFKSRKDSEKKYLDSSKDSEQRVRRLQVIADETDPNVSTEKAKYRRGHVPTNEAMYGMKKGGAVKKYAKGGDVQSESSKLDQKNAEMDKAQAEGLNRYQAEQAKEAKANADSRKSMPSFKIEKKAKGGVVKSSASSRADGCAVKGKTKGRMV
jgi:hypothetical protein